MMPLAMMKLTSPLAREVLEAAGWDTLDAERPPASGGQEARPVDLWVVEITEDHFAADLRELQILKSHAPTLRLVVIAASLQDSAGRRITDVLLDVPVIRRGFERELLWQAVAAA